MAHSFEGTTLALQHYYDIVGTSRKLPLLTVYQANEHPFGSRMAVWMASYTDDMKLPEETLHRLDDALLKNRAIATPYTLRVLDYGTSEGNSFVVTDALEAISLRSWLRAHGPAAPWQALRLLEQLTDIITSAHNADFRDLCLTSDNIYITDEERFSIMTGPLGIGLHRAEILKLRDITISADMMRHLPPWEFTRTPTSSPSQAFSIIGQAAQDTSDATDDSIASQAHESSSITPPTPEEAQSLQNLLPDESIAKPADHDDSIQELDAQSAAIDSDSDSLLNIPQAPEGECPDIYSLAVVVYEALSAQHPYFHEGRDLCDAALSIVQATPAVLANHVDISEELSSVVMEELAHPQKDSAAEFLARFSAQCTESDREKASQAEKIWISMKPAQSGSRKKKKSAVKIQHPYIAMAVAAFIVLSIAIGITWKLAQYHEPVDLFSLPEIMPNVPDGVDIVIAARTNPPDTKIYLTSMADGTLIELGTLPYIHRHQDPGAKLNFLIADDAGHSLQVPVIVKGGDSLMMIPVDLNW